MSHCQVSYLPSDSCQVKQNHDSMNQNRRHFIYKSIAGLTAMAVGPGIFSRNLYRINKPYESKPWIEISKEAYLHNVSQISKMAGGKPVIAVLKNNAYGLGDVQVAKILDRAPQIAGIAMVKDERAIALRKEGVSKPILLMGDFDNAIANTLVENEITLSIFSKDSFKKVNALAEKKSTAIKVALYIDTGLGRMGIPFEETIGIAEKIAKNDQAKHYPDLLYTYHSKRFCSSANSTF